MRKIYLTIVSMLLSILVTACNSPNITNKNIDLTNRSEVIGDIETVGAPNSAYSPAGVDETFEAVAIDADQSDANKSITLSGTAVLDNINNYFRRQSPVGTLDRVGHNLMISYIKNPIVSLDFDEHGYITTANLYVGDNHFIADDPSESNSRNFFQNYLDPNHGRTIIEIKRNFQEEPSDDDSFSFTNDNNHNDELWNFMANHMLNIRWVVGDEGYETNKLRDEDVYYDGYMIAGFETKGDMIDSNSTGEVTFHGSGQGYNTANQYSPSYAGIYFNVMARVNFATRIVGFETIDTQFCFNQRDATGFNWTCNLIPPLDFSTDLTYDAGKNNLTGAIEASGMTGTVEARFYGTGDNAARELGGTFAMRHGYARYTGSFGAIRTDVWNIFTDDTAPDVNIFTYDSLQAISEDADADTDDMNDDKEIILAGTAVQERIKKFYNRPPTHSVVVDDGDDDDDNNETMLVESPPSWSEADHLASEDHFIARINDPIISLTFNDDGEIASTSLYIGDNAYTATLDGTGSATYFSEGLEGLDSGIVSTVTINRNFNDGNRGFDFTGQYLMNIYWNIDERSLPQTHTTSLNTERDGFMITGFETPFSDIPTSEMVEFSGNGRGYYRGSGSSYDIRFTRFDITANVDFSTRMVELQANNSSYGYFLDFTTTLSYDAGQNNISGAVETEGHIDDDDPENNIDPLIGRVEARFYGTKDDATEELGGTFAMRNGISNYYYGYFGAFKEHDIDNSFDDVSMIALRGTDRRVELSSLAVESSITADFKRTDTNANVSWIHTDISNMSVENSVLAKTDIRNPEITITYSRGDYEKDGSNITAGLLAEAEVTFNDGARNYTYRLDDGGNGNSTEILIDGLLAENSTFALGYMEVSRGQNFGFETKYMVDARWNLVSNILWGDIPEKYADNNSSQTSLIYENKRTELNATLTSGFIVAGLATGDSNLPTSRGLNFAETMMPLVGNANFMGRGAGYYYDAVLPQLVEFDVSATVDFAALTAKIETSNTMGYSCKIVTTKCDDAARTPLSDLNFSTGDISYMAGVNNISKTDLTIDGMTGSINARFYGTVTEEFGGTFHLEDTGDGKYYTGYFGARYFADSFDDLSLLSVAGAEREVENPSLAVGASIIADFTRTQPTADASASWLYDTTLADVTFADITLAKTDFTAPKVTITYGSEGLLNEALVTFNDGANNISYALDGDNGEATKILRQGLLADNDAFDLGYMVMSRGQEFGFESQYMLATRWHLTKNIDDDSATTQTAAEFTNGFMITGFETGGTPVSPDSSSLNFIDTALPLKGDATFTGNGIGYYYDVTALQLVEFDMNTTVDFVNRMAKIETSNTMGYSCTFFNTQCDDATRTALSDLDFSTGDISYMAGENNISKTDLMVDGMMGTIQARFYGPTAEEFGGTFHLENTGDGEYYMGYFGALRLTESFDDLSLLSEAGIDRAVELSSLGVSASLDVAIDKAETITNAWLDDALLADLTLTSDTTPTLEQATITAPKINITYDGENIAQAIVSFTDGSTDQTYRLNETTSTSTLLEGALDDDTRFVTGSMEVTRGNNSSKIFGFESKYMAAARWNLISNSGDDTGANTAFEDAATSANIKQTTGFMITGLETGNSNAFVSGRLNFTETTMPTTGTAVAFTGAGAGIFIDKTGLTDGISLADTLYHTEFMLSATVNFEARMVNMTASDTMIYSCKKITASCSGADANTKESADLNFSVTGLGYDAGVNGVAGDVEITGDHAMSGSINARFYGPDATELGGTFQMGTEDKNYMGYFGAKQ